MSFNAKVYITIDVSKLNIEDKKKITEEISNFLGYFPNDADYLEEVEKLVWDLEDDGMNEEVYINYNEILELKDILMKIHKKYNIDIIMYIWNLEEPDYKLELRG